jgi:hypothetical protein
MSLGGYPCQEMGLLPLIRTLWERVRRPLLVAIPISGLATSPGHPMAIVVAGDQLILAGPVISGDYDAVESNLSFNPQIKTIILRNSPGGDAPTGYRLGEFFRQRSLQTAVSGYWRTRRSTCHPKPPPSLPVGHLGFGAMRITGQGIWGPPRDESEAIALLRRVVDKGVTFIDTADSYGPGISETLIAKALHPYARQSPFPDDRDHRLFEERRHA